MAPQMEVSEVEINALICFFDQILPLENVDINPPEFKATIVAFSDRLRLLRGAL